NVLFHRKLLINTRGYRFDSILLGCSSHMKKPIIQSSTMSASSASIRMLHSKALHAAKPQLASMSAFLESSFAKSRETIVNTKTPLQHTMRKSDNESSIYLA
ncbi:hypothetical protein SARC_09674, partial [Sphaeroforma arctica JP610]